MLESSTTILVNKKWMLCSLASFLGFLLLLLCLNKEEEIPPQLSDDASPHYSSAREMTSLKAHAQSSHGLVSTKAQQELSPQSSNSVEEGVCDLFDGRWVHDPKNYPLYGASRCPFLSSQVTCRKNGRPDSDYEHWRWEPNGCKLSSFNGTQMLETLRRKRVAIVGDSLNRNQWESLVCLLYSAAHRSRTLIKTKSSEYKIFRALDYNCSVEFFWSPFLVKLEDRSGAKVLKLDKLPSSSKRWKDADVIVFNTGHWWTHHRKMRAWEYFETNGKLIGEMEVNVAFESALQTWAKWVDRKLDSNKTTVFFRGISPLHMRESQHWCYNQTHPITTETYIQWFPKSMVSIVERTINKMSTPVKYLNITRLSEYRREGHTSVYTSKQGKLLSLDQRRNPVEFADCSHWCLPGVPDTWNVLLYAFIVGIPSFSL